MMYELRLHALEAMDTPSIAEQAPSDWQPEPPERLEVFFTRLEQALLHVGFLNPAQPKRLMQRLRRLFLRARPDENELNILNGIASALLEATPRSAKGSSEEPAPEPTKKETH